jgi:hypothetical protein
MKGGNEGTKGEEQGSGNRDQGTGNRDQGLGDQGTMKLWTAEEVKKGGGKGWSGGLARGARWGLAWRVR